MLGFRALFKIWLQLYASNIVLSKLCRSVLILSGNGADIAKHCVPAVPAKRYAILCFWHIKRVKILTFFNFLVLNFSYCFDECRISITFRKMDDSRLPFKFSPDPELLRIKPIYHSPLDESRVQQNEHNNHLAYSHAAGSSFQHNQHQYDEESYMHETETFRRMDSESFIVENDDFPPLDSSNFRSRVRDTRTRSWR